MTQYDVEFDLMDTLFWNDFKTKLNERFTSHNQILKDGQKLFNLRQGEGLETLA